MSNLDFYQEVDLALEKIPYCSPKCTYYSFCPVCDRSGSTLAACSLRMLPDEKRRRFVNLYLKGREGLKSEILENLFHLGMKLVMRGNSATPEDIERYLSMALKVDRQFKIDQKVLEIPITISEPPKEVEEPEPMIIDVVVTEKSKPKDPIERTVRKVEKELDNNKNSLFNSPVVDEIAAKMRIKKYKSRGDLNSDEQCGDRPS